MADSMLVQGPRGRPNRGAFVARVTPCEQLCTDCSVSAQYVCLHQWGGSMNAFRILIADDHPIFRFGLRSLLGSHEGWQVCGEAADGRDTVEKYRQFKPDLVILDICMPRLNGMDAARQIIKHNPDQLILVITAVDSEHVDRESLEVC